MKYIEFRIHASSQGVEMVSELLMRNGITGISVEDPSDLQDILSKNSDRSLPYLAPVQADAPAAYVVIAGDRGLAGGYNANVFRLAATVKADEVIAIGKRACERFGQEVISSEKVPSVKVKEIADRLCRNFVEGKYGKLGILYTRYRSMLSQEATLKWVLPLEKTEKTGKAEPIFEPDEQTVLNGAVPTYVSGLISACIRESFACEVAARRMAMDSAGKNAQEMIDRLQLQYNRARQNSITQEITEIVAGSGVSDNR